MSQLFNDESSESDIDLNAKSEYAKNYDTWRHKEELHKLHMKYQNDSDTSSSSSDEDEELQVNETFDQDFFKTLSYIKKRDPRIYNNNFDCFTNTGNDTVKKKKKEHTMTLKDYERQLILEKGGQLSDDEPENTDRHSPTYVEEQKRLKDDLKKALSNVGDDGDESEWGGIFKSRNKSAAETTEEDNEFKLWLAGQKEHLVSQNDENELQPLKEYWTNPKLAEDEKFLRDYILNNRFLEPEDDNYIPTYEEVVHDSDQGLSEDEKALSTQEEFEHKYNFRYEEPDQEFIKRYPRTMEQSLRKKDDKRKVKRLERKDRKIEEKKQKMEEIKQLKVLKKQEIEDKIKKLQEVTGNESVGFELKDLDEDFDPMAHDQRMQELFSNEFYNGPEDEVKPEFPELDEELDIEKWDDWRGNEQTEEVGEEETVQTEPHCEDEHFNMDCDYDPTAHHKELINNSRKKKRQRRKSKFAKLVSEPKPVFNPDNKTYQQYLDEYYKLDCEDVIADIPCRFKYRSVIPNDFGLSVEEILMAKDKELNRWNSLKKAVQYRPEHVEKYDVVAFRKKGQNENLKRKFLPSLFVEDETDHTMPTTSEVEKNVKDTNQRFILANKEIKKRKGESSENVTETITQTDVDFEVTSIRNKNKKRKISEETISSSFTENKDVSASPKKLKLTESIHSEIYNIVSSSDNVNKVKKSKKKKSADMENNVLMDKKEKSNMVSNDKLNKKKKKHKSKEDVGISDARLAAFGINPKRYKNKLKYGIKNI